MKIIDLAEFRKLKPGTIFMKYEPCIFGDLGVKQDTLGERDFLYESITCELDYDSSDAMLDALTSAGVDSEVSLPMDFDATSRDGMFDDNQLFAIYEKQDVVGLIEKLRTCLASAYT